MGYEDRIYVDRGIDASTAALLSRNNDPMTWMAMNGGMNNWSNNPFLYLIFLMMFGRNGLWGNEGANGCANMQLQNIQEAMNNNQNANLIMDGIKGNAGAINQLAQNLNCDFNTLNSCCCDLRNAITQVAGQIGFSSERVINAVNMGDSSVISALKDCCCGTQKAILETSYQNQLQNCQQTNTLTSEMTRGFSGLNFALSNGFANLGYVNAQQTCDLLNAGTANTQRIIDTLNNHWNADLQQKYNDARLELSQKAQNEYLISQLKTTAAA